MGARAPWLCQPPPGPMPAFFSRPSVSNLVTRLTEHPTSVPPLLRGERAESGSGRVPHSCMCANTCTPVGTQTHIPAHTSVGTRAHTHTHSHKTQRRSLTSTRTVSRVRTPLRGRHSGVWGPRGSRGPSPLTASVSVPLLTRPFVYSRPTVTLRTPFLLKTN